MNIHKSESYSEKKMFASTLYENDRSELRSKIDRLLCFLLPIQVIVCTASAYMFTEGDAQKLFGTDQQRVLYVFVISLIIVAVPFFRVSLRSGAPVNGYFVAVGQVLLSGLIAFVTDGALEAYFHLIASLALIAFYREWRAMLLAVIVFSAEKFVRAQFFPNTIALATPGGDINWINHLGWLYFTSALLAASCVRRANEMWAVALRTAESSAADARYRAIVRQSDEAIALIEPDTYRVIECNQYFVDLIGYGNVASSFDTGFELLENDEIRGFAASYYDASSSARAEVWFESVTGKRTPLEFSAFKIQVAGDAMISFSARDITGRKKAEDDLRSAYDDLEAKVAERTKELAASNERMLSEVEQRKLIGSRLREARMFLSKIINEIPMPVFVKDSDGKYVIANPALAGLYGIEAESLIGKTDFDFSGHIEDCERTARDDMKVIETGQDVIIPEQGFTTTDGDIRWLHIHKRPLVTNDGEHKYVLGIASDFTERKTIESQLRHSQKMESIGQLSAGIAHEINTPTQYVGDNIRFVEDAHRDISVLLDEFLNLLEAADAGPVDKEQIETIRSAVKKADLDYLKEEIPLAVGQALDGVSRITAIVRSMRDFAHPGSDDKKAVDLNNAIQSTITVAQNKWKYVADVVTELDEDLPMVSCFVGEINQVVLNMIVNASHAIEDRVGDGSRGKGTITVSTRKANEDWVEVVIADTGGGMPDEVKSRIFDPFFTTKEVGKGTGQGLAISHNVVVGKHNGQLSVDSEVGVGTTFTIRLPLNNGPLDAGEGDMANA